MIRASIAMAAYNGEKYIEEQIESILGLMGEDDELIISYEKSNDETLNLIKKYEAIDGRVHIIGDDKHSVEANFNNAVARCKGKYIFLSDQDDVWINDKINVMVDYFESNKDCVVLISNGYETDDKLNIKGELFDLMNTSSNAIVNFVKGSYLGCQMAFRTRIREKVWPVREQPPLPHDLWLGIQGARFGKVSLIPLKLIKHRLHNNNYSNTSKMNIINVIKNRILFGYELVTRR